MNAKAGELIEDMKKSGALDAGRRVSRDIVFIPERCNIWRLRVTDNAVAAKARKAAPLESPRELVPICSLNVSPFPTNRNGLRVWKALSSDGERLFFSAKEKR